VEAGTKAQQATSGEEEGLRRRLSERERNAGGHYFVGLGYLGLNEKAKAKAELTKALELRPDHVGARAALAQMH
jgi:Tfp pilus assembly protein PilF